MIELTRLGIRKPFLLNPDLIERIESNVDTVVRLTNGVEYVVVESGEEIVDRIIDFRARVIAHGPVIARPAPELGRRQPASSADGEQRGDATVVELPTRDQRDADRDPDRTVQSDTDTTTPHEVPR